MLTPKKTKFRRYHRKRNANAQGVAQKNNTVTFGDIGMIVLDPCELTSRQIEAARRVMARYTKRGGKIFIKVFPHKTITTKGAEVPMGGGKGAPDFFVADIKPGTVVFEIKGVDMQTAKEALKLASYKLPSRCKIITKEI
ncbi:50S ribosomal protein L16 [bacterium]|jgi:large subunit ribosomal protein L16|nr:50S ribosomal protein L16 [bacterium]